MFFVHELAQTLLLVSSPTYILFNYEYSHSSKANQPEESEDLGQSSIVRMT